MKVKYIELEYGHRGTDGIRCGVISRTVVCVVNNVHNLAVSVGTLTAESDTAEREDTGNQIDDDGDETLYDPQNEHDGHQWQIYYHSEQEGEDGLVEQQMFKVSDTDCHRQVRVALLFAFCPLTFVLVG